MSQTLEIPDTLYTALKEAAEARGLTPVAWIAAHLQHAESETESRAKQARWSEDTRRSLRRASGTHSEWREGTLIRGVWNEVH